MAAYEIGHVYRHGGTLMLLYTTILLLSAPIALETAGEENATTR